MTTPDRSWETITFKVEQELLQQLGGIPNRSEFIRNALLLALGSLCPLCKGTGVLTSQKRRHWVRVSRDHQTEQCGECHRMKIYVSPGKR